MREGDVETYAEGFPRVGAFVDSFHDSRPAAADYRKAGIRQALGDVHGEQIVGMVGCGACRAEYAHRRRDSGKFLVAFHELRHDLKDFPGFPCQLSIVDCGLTGAFHLRIEVIHG